jgi:hypothetical protein
MTSVALSAGWWPWRVFRGCRALGLFVSYTAVDRDWAERIACARRQS